MKKKGILITLEGNEGCGKSTQIRLLQRWLKDRGCSVHATREPGGTAVGDEVRAILLNPKFKNLSAHAETLLYMASRAQLIEEVIEPQLRMGRIVLCDRWLDATLAYQGVAQGVDIRWIKSLGRVVTQGIQPVLSLYLDLPVAIGLRRAKRLMGPDRIEQKALSFHESVRRGFLKIAREEPRRFRRLPLTAQESVAHVQERLRAEVLRVL